MNRIVLALVTIAEAACGSRPTTIELEVSYDDDWNLTELQLTASERSSTSAATRTITLLVPDEWAELEQTITVVGMRDTESWAHGAVRVTPEVGETVTAAVGLALLSCATTCVQGARTCVPGGVASCEQQADSCYDYAAPTACSSGTRCGDGVCVPRDPVVLPSNSTTIGGLEQTGITLDVADGYVFDTSSNCHGGSALGDCAPVTLAGSTEICVCRADTVTIHDLEVRGSRSLAILAWSSVTVQGNMVMTPGTGVGDAASAPGTAGGSYGTVGGNGGPAEYGGPALVPLAGGMTGRGTFGGTGGGALQITADALVRVEGTINVPGGGAGSNCSSTTLVGSGGGSGGGLLLEARDVDIVGGVAANGGGGGGGSIRRSDDGTIRCGGSGDNGVASATMGADRGSRATVTCGGSPYAYGGYGGYGSVGDGAGGDSSTPRSDDSSSCSFWAGYGGGGGGGAGRIRVNASNACGCTGFLSPTPTYGVVNVE